MNEVENGVAPRHAQVVPAFVAVTIKRPIDSPVGEVMPAELLRWERKGDLTESARRIIRQVIVKRARGRADYFWDHCTGVRLDEGWQDKLASHDRRRIERVHLTEDKPLEKWTLREFKIAVNMSLEHVLSLLAKVESIYWRPEEPTARAQALLGAGEEATVLVTPELVELARQALEVRWISEVSRKDLRFHYGGDKPLPDWIKEQVRREFVEASFPVLLDRLIRAEKQTAHAEAREIAEAAAKVRAKGSGGDEAEQRWAAMLMRRHLSREGTGRTLADVGVEFGITRERVRQICESMEEYLLEVEVAAPALGRVLKAVAGMAPISVDDADNGARALMGDEAGIESLVSWAVVIGVKDLPIRVQRVKRRLRGQLVDVTVVQGVNAAPWVDAMLKHVSRDCSMFGCTNILRVAGLLAMKEGFAAAQDAIVTALDATSGVRWLDKESGWFTLGDTSNCSAAARVRKIIGTARETVGTDEIAGALASDDVLIYRESSSIGLATPPVHVLRELFMGWPWLKVVQKGRFVAAPGFDATGLLTEMEAALVDVISAHDGVACRFELKEVVLGKLGLTDVLLAQKLGSSPIIERIEHGMYKIRGRRIGDEAVGAARRRLRERMYLSGGAFPVAGADEFFARVTEASLKNEQYSVPARFVDGLRGKKHRILGSDGKVRGEARVTASGAMSGLNRLFPEAREGQLYRVRVTRSGLQVEVCEPEEGGRTIGAE